MFKTEDFGESWENISTDLPEKPVNVIFEDRKNPVLLFLGNDKGVYVSINGGKRWVAMRNNMPTIAVHDLLVHPRENDLVVGTYGRGVYVTDISPLQELDMDLLEKDVFLFAVEPAGQRITRAWGNYGLYGDRHYSTPNESNAVVFNYYLKEKTDETISLMITDPFGEVLSRLRGKDSPGIQRITWNMRIQRSGDQPQGRRGFGPVAEPGEYVAILEMGETKLTRKFDIKEPNGWPLK